MKDFAVIFDVDGVLLELTRDEEEVFFDAFRPWLNPAPLSRDWKSYRIRNDEDILREIIESHGLSASVADDICRAYLNDLKQRLSSGALKSIAIDGVHELVASLVPQLRLGIATANFREAARLRLQQANLWEPLRGLAFGADGGGAKSEILKRAIAASGLASDQVIFVGDNVNDVQAGFENGVHFIGFSTSALRLDQLRGAGAILVCATHAETRALISAIIG